MTKATYPELVLWNTLPLVSKMRQICVQYHFRFDKKGHFSEVWTISRPIQNKMNAVGGGTKWWEKVRGYTTIAAKPLKGEFRPKMDFYLYLRSDGPL